MSKNLEVFNNSELDVQVRTVKNNDGSISINAEDTALGFGWYRVKNGKEYIMWDRVNGFIRDLGFPQKCGKQDYIPESLFYLLGMKANNDTAKKFQLWIATEVLPTIRKHGAFIGEDADVDYVNNEIRFSKGRTIKTFANATVAEIGGLYKEFKEYVNDEYKYDTKERIARYESVEKGLKRLHDDMATDVGNIGDCYNINKLVQCVIIDKTTLQKRVSGGVKAGKTKQIARLEDELENSITYPRESEIIMLPIHGMSNNYLYRSTGEGTFKTYTYNKWINEFPYDEVPDEDYWEVDFTKPIQVFLTYVAKPDIDIRNLDKAIIDQLITRCYGYDDNIVDSVISQRVGVCDKYEDGKIGFFICNI